jgi:hypothetical protein
MTNTATAQTEKEVAEDRAKTTADNGRDSPPPPPSITVQTQLSFTTIVANGLMFFTALTIRDYMSVNVHVLPKGVLRNWSGIREFIKLIITLLIVACLIVGLERWKRKIEQ